MLLHTIPDGSAKHLPCRDCIGSSGNPGIFFLSHCLLHGCQQSERDHGSNGSPVVIRALQVPQGSSQFRYLLPGSQRSQHLADS